jgi:hypothetical protein
MKFKMWSFLYWGNIIACIIGITFLFLIYYSSEFSLLLIVDIFLVCIFLSPVFLSLAMARKMYSIIKLDKRGVWVTCLKFKLAFIPWNEIKELGIGTHLDSGVPFRWIYFSRYHLTEDEKRKMQNYSVSNEMIKLKYNKKTVKAVLKYWNKEIVGLTEEEKGKVLKTI